MKLLPRKNLQTFPVLYEVRTKFHFKKIGVVEQVTFYGYQRLIQDSSLLRRVRTNVNKKLEHTNGKLLEIVLSAVFM